MKKKCGNNAAGFRENKKVFWLLHHLLVHISSTRCLKITEKVSFNIASEASYYYILSQNAKKGQFWRVFENLKLAVKQCYQSPDMSVLIGQKLMENAKIQMRHFV